LFGAPVPRAERIQTKGESLEKDGEPFVLPIQLSCPAGTQPMPGRSKRRCTGKQSFIKPERKIAMAKKIQAWVEFGPRLEPTDPISPEGLIERIVIASNQSRGSVKAILDELDVQTEICLKEGHIVQLPNGTHFKPTGHKDGKIEVDVRFNPRIVRNVNVGFRGRWKNAENIGKNEAEIVDLWNAAHPDDPIVLENPPEPG